MAKSRPCSLTAALSAAAVLGYSELPRYRRRGPAADRKRRTPTPPPSHRRPSRPLPDFSLAILAGEQQSIQSWPGKPLLINFWATWCAPCLREIPMLKELQTARPDLQVVGIAIDKPDLVAKFAADIEFNYPILIGQNEAWDAAAALGVNIFALPFTIFTARRRQHPRRPYRRAPRRAPRNVPGRRRRLRDGPDQRRRGARPHRWRDLEPF